MCALFGNAALHLLHHCTLTPCFFRNPYSNINGLQNVASAENAACSYFFPLGGEKREPHRHGPGHPNTTKLIRRRTARRCRARCCLCTKGLSLSLWGRG